MRCEGVAEPPESAQSSEPSDRPGGSAGGCAVLVVVPVRVSAVVMAGPVVVVPGVSGPVPVVGVLPAVMAATPVAAVAVMVAVLVMVPVVHGRPLPVRGSGRADAHDAIMCV